MNHRRSEIGFGSLALKIGFFVVSMEAFAPWLLLVAYVILAAGNLLEGL